MSKLSKEELKWMDNRMKVYEIRYTEIWDEIYDHMVSAIEERRKQGDTREISPIFQGIMDADFGSYRGIELMTKERVDAVQRTLFGALKQEILSHFTFPRVWLFFGLTVLCGWAVSTLQFSIKQVFLTLILLSFVPVFYLCFVEIKHRILWKKPSIVSVYMSGLTFQLASIVNAFFVTLWFFLEADSLRNILFSAWGISVISILAIAILIYTKSVTKVIQTDYREVALR